MMATYHVDLHGPVLIRPGAKEVSEHLGGARAAWSQNVTAELYTLYCILQGILLEEKKEELLQVVEAVSECSCKIGRTYAAGCL